MSCLCHSLGLHRYLRLAKSSTAGISQSIAADLFEAYIGALYLDTKARGHPEILQEWLEKVWSPDVFPGLERRGQGRDAERENAAQTKSAYVKQKGQQRKEKRKKKSQADPVHKKKNKKIRAKPVRVKETVTKTQRRKALRKRQKERLAQQKEMQGEE
jgi:dsRNA-specific ribonuclease